MLKRFPIFLFIVASVVNVAAWIWGQSALAALVKPALMPLLALSTAACALDYRVDRRLLGWLVAAQLFGFLGDTLLIREGFIFFASGIGAFLIGHIFYISLFGGRSWKGLTWKEWVISLPFMMGGVYGLVRLLKISGDLLVPMAVYGFMLMLLIFSTLCGLIRFHHRGAWALVFLGALLFTFSDALIAAETFEVVSFPLLDATIMFTYLLAQSLLAIGGLRLCVKR